ncbi:hypothetical protein M3Y99_00655900 [Aphelenchoides fujianensis]|nr:hypothetical protein M3Y99_00655900 [Aphelenchoides fujianensis]
MKAWTAVSFLLLAIAVVECTLSRPSRTVQKKHVAHKKAQPAHHAASQKKAAGHPQRATFRPRPMDKRREKAIRGGALCENLASNCQKENHLCGQQEFHANIQEFCRLECGLCAPFGGYCRDRVPARCREWKQKGLCHSSTYKKSIVRQMCAKTCNLCGTIDCSHSLNEFLPECLATTCPKKSKQKTKDCKAFCQRYTQLCAGGGGNKTVNCNSAANKYDPKCLAQTCANPAELPTAACQQFCQANPNVSFCLPPTPTCDQTAHFLEERCLGEFCARNASTKFPANSSCANVQPTASPVCDNSATKYDSTCGVYTCRKTAEKGNAGCQTFCDQQPAHASCAGVEPTTNPQCEAPLVANKYDATCAPYTCRKAAEKTSAGCQQWCNDKAGAPECRDVEPVVDALCDAPAQALTDQCLAYTCRKAASKDRPECDNFCRFRPTDATCVFFL